MKYLLIINCI